MAATMIRALFLECDIDHTEIGSIPKRGPHGGSPR